MPWDEKVFGSPAEKKAFFADPRNHPTPEDAAFISAIGWYAKHQFKHNVTPKQQTQMTAYFRACSRKGILPDYSLMKKILGIRF